MPRILALSGVVALAILVVACEPDDGGPTTRIFGGPAWTGDETLSYNLLEGDNHVYGTCTLETRPEFEPGSTRLTRVCGDGPNHDDGMVVVDSKTLRPSAASRVITDQKKNKRTSFQAQYAERDVKLTADDGGKIRDTTRDLPQADAASPDPGWYDDESLLWLVRGIPLKQGFAGAFWDVNVGNAQMVRVEVKVEAQEQLKVPAGSFTAWRVRIRTSSVTQYFWVNVQAPNLVVKARIEQLTYELTGAK